MLRIVATVLAGLTLLGAGLCYAVVWNSLLATHSTFVPAFARYGNAALLLTPLLALLGVSVSRRSPSLRPVAIACLIGGGAWSALFVGLAIAFWRGAS